MEIAQVCYNANRAFSIEIGEDNVPDELASMDILESVMRGIENLILNPMLKPEEAHELWTQYYSERGWVYGEVKDAEAKTHPNLVVPYANLSEAQQQKDVIFLATARDEIAKLDNAETERTE